MTEPPSSSPPSPSDPYPAFRFRPLPPSRFGCIFDLRSVAGASGPASVAYVVDRELRQLLRVLLTVSLDTSEPVSVRGTYLYLGTPHIWYVADVHPIAYSSLSSVQRGLLKATLHDLVMANEDVFLSVYNNARSLTIRLHSLSLLPRFGTQRIFGIMDAKRVRPFTSFSDVVDRVSLVNDAVGFLVARLLFELEHPDEKYHLLPFSGIAPNVMTAGVRLKGRGKKKQKQT